MAGTLSVVATPIGNLEDITLRALRVFKEADAVVCEDTRVTHKLLQHYGITTAVAGFHTRNSAGFERLITMLTEGKKVALVSDAGTPGVSDPGLELVSVVRERLGEEVIIEAIPGPSALAAALSIAGLRAPTFTFYGFLPQKKGRETLLRTIAESEQACMFYESPHRLIKALSALAASLPAERRIGVFRELTKMHEEAQIGPAQEVLAYYEVHPDKVCGECVVIVEEVH